MVHALPPDINISNFRTSSIWIIQPHQNEQKRIPDYTIRQGIVAVVYPGRHLMK